MRHKMITLCPTSYEIAQKKHNFSSWVRMKLLDEAIEMKEMNIKPTQYLYRCLCCTQIITRLDRKPFRCPNPGCALVNQHMKFMGVDE